jgi:hypothetical protein
MRFWNNHHQVHPKLKGWKPNNFKSFGGASKSKGLNWIPKIGKDE